MIPRGLASRIERLIGAKVESYRRVQGGYTPALRLLCRTSEPLMQALIVITCAAGDAGRWAQAISLKSEF